jgi:hypothetical protein
MAQDRAREVGVIEPGPPQAAVRRSARRRFARVRFARDSVVPRRIVRSRLASERLMPRSSRSTRSARLKSGCARLRRRQAFQVLTPRASICRCFLSAMVTPFVIGDP